MSLFGALSSGVSGLQAQSSAMGAIADNVTNVNTVGYKSTLVKFQTLVTAQVSLTQYSPGGVLSAPDTDVDRQGLLRASTSSTDVAISGQGFFVVNEQPTASGGSLFAYTRAGSFGVDKDGFLQNTSGWYLQGWPLQAAGQNISGFATVQVGDDTYIKAYQNTNGDTVAINDNIVTSDSLQPLNLNTVGGTAAETQNIRLGANLPAGADVGDEYKSNVLVYDTLGNKSNLELLWAKDRENGWGLSLETPSGAATIEIHATDNTDAGPDVFASSGLLEFTGVPRDGETIVITDGTGVPITFEFDTDNTVVETSTLRRIDISSPTIVDATDVTPLLKTAIDNSNLQGTGRFDSNGSDLVITQSIMGSGIGIDVSGILTVAQNAANRTDIGNGVFTISEIDFALKNGARIDFQPPYARPAPGLDFVFSGGNTITASSGNPFRGWQVGDTITVDAGMSPTAPGTANNDGTYTILTVTDTVITVAPGSFPSASTESDDSTFSIYNNSTPREVYDNLDTVITPDDTGTAITFRLHNPAQASLLNTFGIDNDFPIGGRADTIDNAAAGVSFDVNDNGANPDTIVATTDVFRNVVVGDVITLSGQTDAANNGDYTVTAVSADGTTLTFAPGSFNSTEASNGASTIDYLRDRITALPGTFGGFRVGDVITITNGEDPGNNQTLSIVGTDGNTYVEFASAATTTLATDNANDESMTITIDRNAAGNIDYVDIGSATSVADIVRQLAEDINDNSEITTPTRFTSDGTSLIFEQSPIGAGIDIVMDSTTGNNTTGIITGVWQDSLTGAANIAADGEIMNMIETTYGAKRSAVSFNGDGTPSEILVDNIDVQWANGASDQEFTTTNDDTRISLFLGNENISDGMTQFAGSYQINFVAQNGAQFGNYAGVSIGEDGVVTALFDNGVTRPVFQIPIATFVNPNKMTSLTGNVFIETDFSGQPTVREAGEGGAGAVTGASLEASTVDLGEEFTSMIVTQRAYSAAAKIITTTDEMLDELLRIR